MTVTAKYASDDIEIDYVEETETDSYGVHGSPTWEAVIDKTIEVQTLSILGVDVKLASLPTDLQHAIHSMCEGLEFE